MVPRLAMASSRFMPMPLSVMVTVPASRHPPRCGCRVLRPRPAAPALAMAAKRRRSQASEALETSSRRKISRWLYREWIMSLQQLAHLRLEAVGLRGCRWSRRLFLSWMPWIARPQAWKGARTGCDLGNRDGIFKRRVRSRALFQAEGSRNCRTESKSVAVPASSTPGGRARGRTPSGPTPRPAPASPRGDTGTARRRARPRRARTSLP